MTHNLTIDRCNAYLQCILFKNAHCGSRLRVLIAFFIEYQLNSSYLIEKYERKQKT